MENKRGYITIYGPGEIEVSLRLGGVPYNIYRFLNDNYPAYYTPKDLQRETGKGYEAIKKAVVYLNKKGLIEKPYRNGRGIYRGTLQKNNINRIEQPEVLLHNIKLKIQSPEVRDSPSPLYTQGNLPVLQKKPGDRAEQEVFWVELGCKMVKVVVQKFEFNVMIHINTSKCPLSYFEVEVLRDRIEGILIGQGVNVSFGLKVITVEMSKDYERVGFNSKEVRIQDLTSQSKLLRLYQKTRGLMRLEFIGSFEHEKELWKEFKDFGGKMDRDLPGYQ